MGDVVDFPEDRCKDIAFDDVPIAKANFRRQFSSLCLAAEYNDIERGWLLAHLMMVCGRSETSLGQHNRDLEKKAYGE